MKLSKRQMQLVKEALGYGVMFSKTESETAEFAIFKMEVETQIRLQSEFETKQAEHDKLGCPFKYCDSEIKCVGKCKYNTN